MTPAELLAVIEDADAAERRGSRRIILELRSPRVLGFIGRPMGRDHEGAVYGYTRKQAREIRDFILAAAEEDAL